MKAFNISLFLKQFPIKRAKEELLKISEIKEADYEAFLEDKKAKIVNYHLKHNPFYRDKVKAGFTSWESLPILKKHDLQIPLKQRLSEGFSEKNVYINKTSGSSGTPFIFAKDKFCHAMTWAEIMDKFGALDIDFNTSLQARFYGIPLDFKGYNIERVKDFFSHRYRFPVFDLSKEKMDVILNTFKIKKFDYINGYTSSILFFAKFLKDKNIVLKQICPTLRYCIVTSEMLFDDDKKLMEAVFGVPVINEYGASEMDLIAFTNNNGALAVNSRTIFVEILDEFDKPVPLGNSGRIIITSLYNKAHAMIRYEIGDIGILAPTSTYKKPILEKLIGRTNDMAKLPSGKIVPGLTFYYVTKSIISSDGNVKEFVIEQTKLNTFKIQYVADKELLQEEKLAIEKAIFDYLEKELLVIFEKVAILKRSKSGKLKQFVSLVEQ